MLLNGILLTSNLAGFIEFMDQLSKSTRLMNEAPVEVATKVRDIINRSCRLNEDNVSNSFLSITSGVLSVSSQISSKSERPSLD